MVITGIIATKEITPKPSAILPATPWQKARINVAVIGPDATPPESKAIPTNICGTLLAKIKDIKNPGTITHPKGKTFYLYPKYGKHNRKGNSYR